MKDVQDPGYPTLADLISSLCVHHVGLVSVALNLNLRCLRRACTQNWTKIAESIHETQEAWRALDSQDADGNYRPLEVKSLMDELPEKISHFESASLTRMLLSS